MVSIVALGAESIDPTMAGHVKRGVAAREAGRLDEAQRELEAAVSGAPNLAEAHLFLGLVLHERADFAGAAASLSRALSLKSKLPGARRLLGYDLLRIGRADEAIEHLAGALDENPDDVEASAWLGQAYLRTGRLSAAVPHLERARDASPPDPELLYLLGKAYSQLSLSSLAELLALAPDSAYARLAVAEDHHLNGRPEEALAAYRDAIDRDPSLLGVWPAIGDIERDRGEYEAGASAYAQGLELEPNDQALHLRRGQALVQLGRSDEALPYLETGAKAEPALVGALTSLGKAQLDLGRLAEAEVTLLKALATADGELERMGIHYQLALVYRRQGSPEAAQHHLREFGALRKKLPVDEE